MLFRIIYIIMNMYKDGRKGTSWIQYRIKPTKQFIIHCGSSQALQQLYAVSGDRKKPR